MTKDWESVQAEIKELSFDQKKSLEDVKALMERKYKFKASTRAYRMKLKEWGYMRHKPRKATRDRNGPRRRDEPSEDFDQNGNCDSDSRSVTAGLSPNLGLEDSMQVDNCLNVTNTTSSVSHPRNPWEQGRQEAIRVVTDMLSAILNGDSQSLEQQILKSPNHINCPIGLPFSAQDGRLYGHPVMDQIVILQHPEQTLFDIACGLPSGPMIWVLAAHGAKGSKHPLGTDLALHNAIKNGRTFTVQSLIHSGHSSVDGLPGTMWKPLLQAVFWNVPDVVRLLIKHGANIHESGPPMGARTGNMSPLQMSLDRRMSNYNDMEVKERCHTIMQMLLETGADVHAPPIEGTTQTCFQMFIKPWQGDPHWISKLTATEMECLTEFIRHGADLGTRFLGFPCGSSTSNTFEHQVLWHSTPAMARLLIDNAYPAAHANGSNLLHEILGCCPDAKRHPADTLRDINVLLKNGADPNSTDVNGFLPLRKCIERCPAVDIIPRMEALLDAGAIPDLKERNDVQPLVLAARTFDEPLLSEVLHLLVSKFSGNYTREYLGETYTWNEGYFPIPDEPILAQVSYYSSHNDDFITNLHRMIPEDIQSTFQRACFSVLSKNFLDVMLRRAKMNLPLQMTSSEKDEVFQMIRTRTDFGLPEYKFDQDFVMSLLKPHYVPVLSGLNSTLGGDTVMLPHQTPISSLAPSSSAFLSTASLAPNPISPTHQASHDTQTQTNNHSRPSSAASNNSANSFFIPETTQLRWKSVGRATRIGDIAACKDAVLKYKCSDCGDGNLLTKSELERHSEEHEHSRECTLVGCKRRFCATRRVLLGLADEDVGMDVGVSLDIPDTMPV